ncbi:MAG: hypothetical protein V3U41_10630 [candidate division NC10 bacterium]
MGDAGRPRVLHRRLVRDATEDEREHELAVKKADNDSALAQTIAKGLLGRAPDLAILGGGYFLGAVMNMRPGITLPNLPGFGEVFIGFPDFGGVIDDLKEELVAAQGNLETLTKAATVITQSASCRERCDEQQQFRQRAGLPFDLQACLEACQEEEFTLTPQIEEARKEVARIKGELRTHTIAQGILMATITYAVTRAGFLQGIGEILPG